MARNIPCTECGEKMSKTNEKEWKLDGLEIRVLLHDVVVWRCPNGHFEDEVPNMEDLMKVLAHTVARFRRPLLPNEIRFLRKFLGFSGKDFAAEMDVEPATVSRWENGKQPMGGAAERFLRLMALTKKPLSKYQEVEEMDPVGVDFKDGKWDVAA